MAILLVSGSIFVRNMDWAHHTLHGLPNIAGELFSELIVGALTILVIHFFHIKDAQHS
ncbi:MAG: hypothetical protein ACI9QV_001345 [Methylophagaceae bacterium]|jgi:hypothetical protein